MSAIPEVNYGRAGDFTLGIEEELLLVDPVDHALRHTAEEVLERLGGAHAGGEACPETYSAIVETASPICSDVAEAVSTLAAWRERLRDVDATAIGSGLHPDGAFGDVVHYPSERYRLIAAEMRGLLARTPTCALHVHVGMPDPESAIRACNGLRSYLPLLQALSANSPFWHGRDSGLASARAQVFRAFPTSEIPALFDSFDHYAERVETLVSAGGLPDYSFLWWDVRPHPVLGTVEIRAMDSQSSLTDVAGIAALVHALTLHAVEGRAPHEDREVLMESSFRAARDGLESSVWYEGALRPVSDAARSAMRVARPYAREHGAEGALDEIERMLMEGNGANRRRTDFDRGGLEAVLSGLVSETADSGERALSLSAAGTRH